MYPLKQILRVLLCTLLMVGYGGMYAGSILHDLGHGTEETHHCDSHDEATVATPSSDDDHSGVTCFFCSHSQVVTDDVTPQQIWTLSTASLAPPLESESTPRSVSVLLSELRGPPAV